MTTTHLFVELLVIGFGALIWLLLLIATVFGLDAAAVKENFLSLGAIFPILSLVYVLGILTDRVADWLFDWLWNIKHLRRVYGDSDADRQQYFSDRRILVVEGHELWLFVEYGRSRLRICRGWALNSTIMAFLVTFLFFTNRAPWLTGKQYLVTTAGISILALLCWFSWSKLNFKEYKKIKRQAVWLRERLDENRKQEIELSGSLTVNRETEHEPAAETSLSD